MPAVNDVGEPCAGEPHARFDGRGLETGRKHCRTAPAPDPTPGSVAASLLRCGRVSRFGRGGVPRGAAGRVSGWCSLVGGQLRGVGLRSVAV